MRWSLASAIASGEMSAVHLACIMFSSSVPAARSYYSLILHEYMTVAMLCPAAHRSSIDGAKCGSCSEGDKVKRVVWPQCCRVGTDVTDRKVAVLLHGDDAAQRQPEPSPVGR